MNQHLFYEPTNEFIERHSLAINEAETWVYLSAPREHRIDYNKEEGWIVLRDEHGDVLFVGLLPDEAALESVIAWTRWGDRPH